MFHCMVSPVPASHAAAVSSWKGQCAMVTALVLPPGSDEDRGEWPDSVPAADQGQLLEVGAGQRPARLQEWQTRVYRGHTETPRVRAGAGMGTAWLSLWLWDVLSRAGCWICHCCLCLLKEQLWDSVLGAVQPHPRLQGHPSIGVMLSYAAVVWFLCECICGNACWM